jgi:hypothetical protein
MFFGGGRRGVRRRTAQAVMVLVLTGIVAAYTVVNWPQR